MTASVRQIEPQRLVSLARAFHLLDADEAAGRCLSVAFDVAIEAKARLGLDLNLIRWRVVADPHYMDHWAILLDDGRVLDPTRVQVDGSRALVGPAGGYPQNFLEARVYPASLLIARYQRTPLRAEGRLNSGFMWRCALSMLSFDLRAAARDRDAGGAGAAIRTWLRFLRCFMTAGVQRRLVRRAEHLLTCLSGEPSGRDAGRASVDPGIDLSRRVG